MKSLFAGPASCSSHSFLLLPSVQTSVPHLRNCRKNLNLVSIIRVWEQTDKACKVVRMTTNEEKKQERESLSSTCSDTAATADPHTSLYLRTNNVFVITWYAWYAELSVRKSNCRSSKNSTAITVVSRLFPTTGLNACTSKRKKEKNPKTLRLQNQLSETSKLQNLLNRSEKKIKNRGKEGKMVRSTRVGTMRRGSKGCRKKQRKGKEGSDE